MTNIWNDVSTLTGLPEKILLKLNETILYSICETIDEDKKNGKNISEFNFYLFKLYIKHESNDLKYKIIPSEKLTTELKNTLNNKSNLLEKTLSKSFTEKLLNLYKDIC